jgi:hypothetical protein
MMAMRFWLSDGDVGLLYRDHTSKCLAAFRADAPLLEADCHALLHPTQRSRNEYFRGDRAEGVAAEAGCDTRKRPVRGGAKRKAGRQYLSPA